MAKNVIAFVAKTLVTAVISISAFLGVIGTPVSELHNIADYKLVSTNEMQVAREEGYKAGYEAGYEAGSKKASSSSSRQSVTTNESRTTMYVVDGPLNLRESPSTNADSLALLEDNQAVSVDRMDNGWAHVAVNGMAGWCAADYLSYTKTASGSHSEKMVWVSRTGECYHSDPNCSNMYDPISMTESEAINTGHRACSKCF